MLRSAGARGGGRTWLWLRHEHGFVVLSVDGEAVRRAFDRLRVPEGEALDLVAPGEDLVADGEGLVYLERERGRLWRIGACGPWRPPVSYRASEDRIGPQRRRFQGS